MRLRKLVLIVVMVAALGLLIQATPGLTINCFDPGCSVTGSEDGNPLLYLANYGTGDGLICTSSDGTGISASGFGKGISCSGKIYGLLSKATDPLVSVYGVVGEAKNSPTGAGVLGYGGNSGWGVYGEAYTQGIGVMGRGKYGVYGDGETGVWGRNYSTSGSGVGVYGESLGNPLGFGVWGFSEKNIGVKGYGVKGVLGWSSTDNGYGGWFINDGGGTGVYSQVTAPAPKAGVLGKNLGAGYGVAGQSSHGTAGYFVLNNVDNAKPALQAKTTGTGWAAEFIGLTATNSKGVHIKTAGGTALSVQGGTKSAVVPTSQGARALYAEEAAEVYFTDYGFGKLENGKAVVRVDPLFAETVNLKQPYHVFVQAYGNAEIYVSQRTPTGFEVSLRGGDDRVEFSYRLVGKRQGFEQARLEHAAWADKQPDFKEDLSDSDMVAAAH